MTTTLPIPDKFKIPDGATFSFCISSVKDWYETLSVLQRQRKDGTFVVLKDHMSTTRVDEYLEDVLYCALHENMLDYLQVRKPVVFGVHIPMWTKHLNYFKSQRVRFVQVYNSPKEGKIYLKGDNPSSTQLSDLVRSIPVIEVNPDIAILTRKPRKYTLGAIDIPAKPFYQHCRNLAQNNNWVEMTVDVMARKLMLTGLSDQSQVIIDLKIVGHPLSCLRTICPGFTPELVTLFHSFLTPNIPLRISNIYAADKLRMYAYAFRVN